MGDAQQLSRLGEPLRLSIPILPDAGTVQNERCLAAAWPSESDGLPHIMTARVAIEQQRGGRQLMVTTASAVRDPVTRLMLRTTCDGMTRVYTLFLEPPGSDRVIRAIGRTGPRLPELASGIAPNASLPDAGIADRARATESTVAATVASRPDSSAADRASAGSVVTIIPVIPAGSGISSAAPEPRASSPAPRASSPAVAASVRATTQPVPIPPLAASASAIATENANLKQQIAELGDELHRLQNGNNPASPAPPVPAITSLPPPIALSVSAPEHPSSSIAQWNGGWPVAIALGGLASLTLGGFMWRRRQGLPSDEWALTGPPSHRMASRTSLAEQPVPFKQAGVRTDIDLQTDPAFSLPSESAGTESYVAEAALPQRAPATSAQLTLASQHATDAPAIGEIPPAPLLLQPSAEELGRDLEHELVVAERSHSALERSHPDLIELLTRSWGTAAARGHLAALVATGSLEMNRMSGEAVGEVRLLLRVAEELGQHQSTARPPLALTPPAPAW